MGAVTAGPPAMPPDRGSHPPPFVVGRRGAVALVVVMPVVSAVGSSWGGGHKDRVGDPRAG